MDMEKMKIATEVPQKGATDLYVTHPVIRTYTGHYINVFEPDPDKIDILDIAHALSMNCRWTGHCPFFWSVAQHSLLVAALVNPRLGMEALLHDASEAYIHDIATPIKRAMPEYIAVEKNLQDAIMDAFLGYTEPHQEVKDADKRALEAEWNYFYGDKSRDPLASDIIYRLSSSRADWCDFGGKEAFLRVYHHRFWNSI